MEQQTDSHCAYGKYSAPVMSAYKTGRKAKGRNRNRSIAATHDSRACAQHNAMQCPGIVEISQTITSQKMNVLTTLLLIIPDALFCINSTALTIRTSNKKAQLTQRERATAVHV